NISADPSFRDSSAGNYRLQADSPAIDSGTSDGAPPSDLDAAPRPVDGDGDGIVKFDMGAYEAPLVDTTPPVTTANHRSDAEWHGLEPDEYDGYPQRNR